MHTENWVGNSLMFYIIINASAAFETIIWSLGVFGLHPLPKIEQDERMNSQTTSEQVPQEFASIQSKAIGLRKESGMPNELTTASA